MEKKDSLTALKVLIVLSFLVMAAVNMLANVLPINGVTTGAVSDAYQNLFAPAGITFAIWFVIYVLLFLFALYAAGLFRGSNGELLKKTGVWFAASSASNTAWILAWHFDIIWLSMVFMAALFVCLAVIYSRLSRADLSMKEKLFFRLPISVYFGWITVATVANATTLLVSIGWDGFGLSEQVWMVIATAVAALIGLATIIKNRDAAYGLVFLWAYAGILLKHYAPWGFAGQYPAVTTAVIAALALLAWETLKAAFKNKKAANA